MITNVQNSPTFQRSTTFQVAIPYGLASLTAGAIGAGLAYTATTTALIVAGVVLAMIGSYAFFGVLACGFAYQGRPHEFQENVGKFVVTAAGAAISEVITEVARAVLLDLIFGRASRR